ncbi:MAG: glycoside hydrolase family 38 [Puniceicoccales bacterium]
MAHTPFTFHLIGNAHLDPVWLWDWREGFNEAINTTRAMLELLEEFPDLTVVRGESALYEFIEKEDPELFQRVLEMIAQGRWEPVGGTFVQCDNNLPHGTTLERQFGEGQRYFQEKLGKRTNTAWFPDSFGHSAGLPGILKRAGIQHFAHCRPFASTMPLSEPAYWWEGHDGTRILAYRSAVDWYCNDWRDSMPERLDAYLREARKGRLQNIAVFYGLGNHGGGPTRRLLRDLQEWAEQHQDEVTVVHSGLSRYFESVKAELEARPDLELPLVRGELNFCLRGCYASVAKFKIRYRQAEQQLLRAELTAHTVEQLVTGFQSSSLRNTWKTLLFNSFHDILPGSAIERALEEQMAQVGAVFHSAQQVEFAAINALARAVDMPSKAIEDDQPGPVTFLLFNPHPETFDEVVEIEAQLDWRPISGYRGERTQCVPIEVLNAEGLPMVFQRIKVESRAMTDMVWRVRVALPIKLAPSGWEMVTIQYKEEPQLSRRISGIKQTQEGITNGRISLNAKVGEDCIHWLEGDTSVLGESGLGIALYEDPFGSWGGLLEEPESYLIGEPREQFTISHTAILEEGPELIRMWVRFSGRNSRFDMTLDLHAESDRVDWSGRLFLNDSSCRVRMLLPGDITAAQYEIPGGSIQRTQPGETPGIGWVIGQREDAPVFGFSSDACSSFNISERQLLVTLARASRYADDVPTPSGQLPHLPSVDCGELRFRGLLTTKTETLKRDSLFLGQPPIIQMVPTSNGRLTRRGCAADYTDA